MRLDGVEILVLAPGEEPAGDPSDPNDVSVAVRVRVGGFVYLNTGDAPVAVEEAILGAWPADSLRAAALKLGHHGSRTSSSRRWLSTVAPEIALLSVGGRNRHGHPHASVLARLDSAGVPRVWRTDRQGTACLRVEPDGGWRAVAP